MAVVREEGTVPGKRGAAVARGAGVEHQAGAGDRSLEGQTGEGGSGGTEVGAAAGRAGEEVLVALSLEVVVERPLVVEVAVWHSWADRGEASGTARAAVAVPSSRGPSASAEHPRTADAGDQRATVGSGRLVIWRNKIFVY